MKYILEYNEFNDLTTEEQEIKDKALTDGTFMKAPNGKKTKLTEKQWLQVRTKNFINWFGDWLNDPKNASKIVDENREPLVTHHGSDVEFNEFDKEYQSEWSYFGRGFYFTSIKNRHIEYGDVLISAFLSIRNPFYFYGQSLKNGIDDEIKNNNYDGVIIDDEKVVFEPFQIKSATNNNGDFNPINKNINN